MADIYSTDSPSDHQLKADQPICPLCGRWDADLYPVYEYGRCVCYACLCAVCEVPGRPSPITQTITLLAAAPLAVVLEVLALAASYPKGGHYDRDL